MTRTIGFALVLLLAACGGVVAPFTPDAGLPSEPVVPLPPVPGTDGGTVAAGPSLGGCPMFPAGNEWNRDVSGDPIDPGSDAFLAFMGGGSLMLHPDFGGPWGQPFLVVPPGQAGAPMQFLYAGESDPGPYPFPQDVPIQDAPDKHVTVLSQGDCKLYETYLTLPDGNGGFHADSGAVFDLLTGASRPTGWTAATAAGLPILPGMARYDEAAQGEIRHALAFVAGGSAHAYVAPATHSNGTSTSSSAPPLGLRVRLKASYDLSGFTGQSLAVLTALKRYGMFLTDNADGQFWSIAGAQDSRWDDANLQQIKTVPSSAFEVVKLGPVQPGL